jgi:hypothetical protein
MLKWKMMKRRIYFTTIAAITVFISGLVPANNTTNSLGQSTENIQGLTVRRTEGSIIAPKDVEDLIVIGKPTQAIAESKPLIQSDGGEVFAFSHATRKNIRLIQTVLVEKIVLP